MIILKIQDISLQFASNTCFENFTAQIVQGQKIAVIGNNGSGKSSLLKLLRSEVELVCGSIDFSSDLRVEYMDQIMLLSIKKDHYCKIFLVHNFLTFYIFRLFVKIRDIF